MSDSSDDDGRDFTKKGKTAYDQQRTILEKLMSNPVLDFKLFFLL